MNKYSKTFIAVASAVSLILSGCNTNEISNSESSGAVYSEPFADVQMSELETLDALAFAMTNTIFSNINSVESAEGKWQTIESFIAYQKKMTGINGISEQKAEEIQRSILGGEVFECPQSILDSGKLTYENGVYRISDLSEVFEKLTTSYSFFSELFEGLTATIREQDENDTVTDYVCEFSVSSGNENQLPFTIGAVLNSYSSVIEGGLPEITLENVAEANRISNILANHSAVRAERANSWIELYYKNGELAAASKYRDIDYDVYLLSYGAVDFRMLDNEANFMAYRPNNAEYYESEITNIFTAAENFSIIDENGATCTIEYIGENDILNKIKYTAVLNRTDLTLIRCSTEETESLIECYYDCPLFSEETMAMWDGEMKNLHLVTENNNEGGIVTDYSFAIPSSMKYDGGNGYRPYMNPEMTIEYEYPGDGVDLSIYRTDAVG